MIPYKLQLKNFLSYGPQLQTIDFSSHSLICLSGKNGHGKSALLDAITWALWGQARKVIGSAKADQGLLRLGQTQMLVIFDFEFNGTLYRIRREYMETFSKPMAVLEFGTLHPQTEEFIPLTDKTIRATQTKIEQILGLDFEAFTNSAFLRQGNSNEFSKKTPKDRKQILASILGLNQYEAIRTQALEKIKHATAEKNTLIMLQEKRRSELSAEELLNQELVALEQNMNSIVQEEKEWQKQQDILKKNKKELDELRNRYSLMIFQQQQRATQKKVSLEQLAALRQTWRTINIKKRTLNNTHLIEKQKKQIVRDITAYQQLFQTHLAAKEEMLRITHEIHSVEQKHKATIAQQQQTLLIEMERLNADKDNKQKIILLLDDEHKKNEIEYAQLTQTIADLSTRIQENTITQEMIQHAEALLEKRKNTYQSFVALGNMISNELKNIVQKKQLIHADDPSCPLCEQNLSASRKRFLNANMCKNESFFAHRLNRLKRIIPQLKESLVTEHSALLNQKEQLRIKEQTILKKEELCAAQDKLALASITLTTKSATHQQEIISLTEAVKKHQEQITFIASNNQIANIPEYQALMQQKAVTEKKLSESACNPEVYEQKQAELVALEKQLLDYEALQQEIGQQNRRKEEIHEICTLLKQLKQEETALQKELDALHDLTLKYNQLTQQEKEHNEQLTTLQTKKERLLLTKGSIKTQQQRLTTIKHEYEQEQKNLAQLDETIQDYQIICTATGKDGIQALLIEEAIPEIEQEANQLLSQLTNNQAHIFIESLRDLKKGGTKETLDIKISDHNGIRPYELFSGGEAFRIDFALRIAISKLLARRSGIALQTLIIDEGFGSQDDEGLSHIMDALHAIQSNFSKIIIVSHLSAMKDQFPVQFLIQKGVQGSTITVVEQG